MMNFMKKQWSLPIYTLIALFFGVLVPGALLLEARNGLIETVGRVAQLNSIEEQVKAFKLLNEGVDKSEQNYPLFAIINSENANQKMMLNKQAMKLAVIQIGFAVSSMGIMLVIFGISDGANNVLAEGGGYKINLRLSSTGVLVFLVGAAMAAMGGIMPNQYNTVSLESIHSDASAKKLTQLQGAYEQCRNQNPGGDGAQCFFGFFRKINGG